MIVSKSSPNMSVFCWTFGAHYCLRAWAHWWIICAIRQKEEKNGTAHPVPCKPRNKSSIEHGTPNMVSIFTNKEKFASARPSFSYWWRYPLLVLLALWWYGEWSVWYSLGSPEGKIPRALPLSIKNMHSSTFNSVKNFFIMIAYTVHIVNEV